MGFIVRRDYSNPPPGLKEEYYDTAITLNGLAKKYGVGTATIAVYANKYAWPTMRQRPSTHSEKQFVHKWIRGGEVPKLPDLADMVETLKNWPKTWRKYDTYEPGNRDDFDPFFICHRRIGEPSKMR